jgi:hypothetical protein
MIARIQLKGNSAEVFIDEVDAQLIGDPKKWLKNPDWRSYSKVHHISGVINSDKPTIILMDKGNEFMSYKMKSFWDGYYRYQYLSKRPSSAETSAIAALESSKGIVFDSGDFECPDDTKWGHFHFDISRVIALDSATQEKLDLELITAVYLNKEKFEAGEALPNIAQPEKKKTAKLFVDRFDAANSGDIDCSLLKPSWA